MTHLKFFGALCVLLSGLILSSCDSNRVFEDYVKIPDSKWDREHIVSFEVNITDTLNPHNLYVDVRNSGKYTKANLWLFIRTISPKGEVVKDTFNCPLADETGRWYGSGFGDIFDSQFLLKTRVVFPHSGTYVFEYEQGMREKKIPGIVDVGLRVEKSE
ncbi:MAG: gliding motility lipoprotein GldH [Marinifilaceae bacterium]|jgi:gliding motility-associated lipoprotein GldH